MTYLELYFEYAEALFLPIFFFGFFSLLSPNQIDSGNDPGQAVYFDILSWIKEDVNFWQKILFVEFSSQNSITESGFQNIDQKFTGLKIVEDL